MKTTLPPMAAALVLLASSINAYSAPTAPTLSFLHYSDSAAELFWTRSSSDAGGLVYTVSRNGEIVFSGDALSFFDDSLETGPQYNYSLIVSDSTGSQSPAVGVVISSSDDTPAQPLSAPEGLRSAVYSASALELFWTRDSSQTLSYEIFQDGVSLGTTDGTSFYISSGVQRNTLYRFDVIAQRSDSAGSQSSVPSVLNVSLDAVDTSTPPSVPANARIQRYSRSTAELFWDRAAAEEQIESTEIYRNSELLGTTQGTSFLDTGRADETTYLYTLVSINANGARSSEAQVLEETASEFAVTSDNLDEILSTIAAIANASPFDSLVQTANDMVLGNVEGFELLSAEQGASSRVRISTYSCNPSGSLIHTMVERGTLGNLNTAVATDCALNGLSYSGQIEQEDGISTLLDISDFTLLTNSGAGARLNAFATIVSAGVEVRSLNSERYEEFDASGMVSTSITDYNTTVADQNLSSNFTANLQGYPEFTATTLTDFSPALGRLDNLLIGTLRVVFADNGPTLIIDADNGDPASFTVTVENGASSTSYTVDWTLANRYFLAFGS